MSMDKDKQRIAIAEACGFVPNGCGYWIKDGQMYGRKFEAGIDFGSNCLTLPDFAISLDAMHAAEKSLPKDFDSLERHLENLCEATEADYHSGDAEEILKCVGANAAQRAEAFLRTLNLWTPTGEENE